MNLYNHAQTVAAVQYILLEIKTTIKFINWYSVSHEVRTQEVPEMNNGLLIAMSETAKSFFLSISFFILGIV